MQLLAPLNIFSALDGIAVLLLISFWLLIGWRIEHPAEHRPSVSKIMARYRQAWMQQMITRQPRIFDAQTIATLRQGTAFFASTAVIAIGGALALLGNAEGLITVTAQLTRQDQSSFMVELKLLLIVFFLTNAFLKFVWANRLFGYCSVVMAAVPNDPQDPDASSMARQAADLNVTAARSFNRGLRSVYFGLASVSWLGGPVLLITASTLTVVVIWRREFASQSRQILLEPR
ncbi:MAG: DUF599 domain-containing protein [Pseudomonadota bacterium]